MTVRGSMGGHRVHLTEDGWVYDDTQLRADGSRACRHCGLPPVLVPVLKPSDSTYDGRDRYDVVQVDACIADLVRQLNAGAVVPVTAGACCRHGEADPEIILADGRLIQIRPKKWRKKRWKKARKRREKREKKKRK